MSVQWDVNATLKDLSSSFTTLASDTSALSAHISDLTPEWTFANLLVRADSGTNFTEGDVFVDAYLIAEISDTANEDQEHDASLTPTNEPSAYIGSLIKASGGTLGTARGIIRGIELPPGDFEILLHNRHGAAWQATVAVKLQTYRLKDV